MLQDGQRYFLTRSNIQTLSPPPADHIYPASANTPASTLNIINTDDSTPKPSAYKVVERPARDDDTINETLHEQEMIRAVKESRASLKHEQNNTPDNKNHNLSASSLTYESASPNTFAPTPNPTNTLDNMPKPSAHTPNHSPTSLTTPHKMRWAQEEYSTWTEDTQGAATHTAYLAPEGNTTEESDDDPLPPKPPNEPAPAVTRTPAPPPDEQQDEDGLTDEKGITMHKDGRQYKVTVKYNYSRTQYTTRWGAGREPYTELTDARLEKGRDGSGNCTWQKARCPAYYNHCRSEQHIQGQLAIQG